MGKHKKRRPPAASRRGRRTSEWVGGRLTTPFYITEPAPFRPEVVFWLELPADLIVGHKFIDPAEPPVAFGRTLSEAMAAPLAGPPRRPQRIRVADARLAAEVHEAAPDIEVVVAPTPELDRLLRYMAETMPGGDDRDPSYFEGGRVSAEAVEQLFRATHALYRAAPWQAADDTQVLRLDIPALQVEGACVSIIGALGESVGLIIFPSHDAFERFLEAVESFEEPPEGTLDMGTSYLALNIERAADLPPSMRREAARHGWAVAAPDAYPWVQHRDADGIARPLVERDVRIASACAASLAAFFSKHRALFGREDEPLVPVYESFTDEDGLQVRLIGPFQP